MEELKKRLMEQARLDEAQCTDAIAVMVEYIKEQIPSHLRGMVDGLLSGGSGSSRGPLDAVKSFFGGS